MSFAKVQEVLLEKYDPELVRDWMLDTSEDFVAKNGVEVEEEMKDYLASEFPQYADSDLLK